MKKIVFLSVVSAAALMFSGCGNDKKVEERVTQIQSNAPVANEANATPANDVKIDKVVATPTVDGKQLFASRCAACHGEKGEGKGTYPKLVGNSKDDAMKKLKGYVDGTYGKAQKMIMVGQAKGLSDAEKAAVAEYIATLK